MKRGGSFLVGATSRLLPMSVPVPLLRRGRRLPPAGLAGAAGRRAAPAAIPGRADWPLAALHLVTLGVLVMTALGASLQLLPVATRQPVRSTRAAGRDLGRVHAGRGRRGAGHGPGPAVAAGRRAPWRWRWRCSAGLRCWPRNLRHARGMPGVVVHGWAALGAPAGDADLGAGAGRALPGPAAARPSDGTGPARGLRSLRLHGPAGAGLFLHPGADVRPQRHARRAPGDRLVWPGRGRAGPGRARPRSASRRCRCAWRRWPWAPAPWPCTCA